MVTGRNTFYPFRRHMFCLYFNLVSRVFISAWYGQDSNQSQESIDKKKRHRRTHSELTRDVVCPYSDCNRCYASKHALQLHMKNKHGWVSRKASAQGAASPASPAAGGTHVDDLNGIRSLFKNSGDGLSSGQTSPTTEFKVCESTRIGLGLSSCSRCVLFFFAFVCNVASFLLLPIDLNGVVEFLSCVHQKDGKSVFSLTCFPPSHLCALWFEAETT